MRNKKAEIGTIVMMVLLVLVSVVAFGSSNFLAKKQTVNTKAATTCPAGIPHNCGSGNYYCCDPNEGYDVSKAGSNLEFACCVANSHQTDDNGNETYQIKRYGYTGQPCSNTKVPVTYLGHLAGCVGYQSSYEDGRFSITGNAVDFSPVTIPISSEDDPSDNTRTCWDVGREDVCIQDCSSSCVKGKTSDSIKWCCTVIGRVENTPIPSETPTPSISCRFQQATCSDRSTKFDYYKLISSDCTGSNLDKLCYGIEVDKCNLYNWADIWKNKCNNTSLPTTVPPVSIGTTPGITPAETETPVLAETSIPAPTLVPSNNCTNLECVSPNKTVWYSYKCGGVMQTISGVQQCPSYNFYEGQNCGGSLRSEKLIQQMETNYCAANYASIYAKRNITITYNVILSKAIDISTDPRAGVEVNISNSFGDCGGGLTLLPNPEIPVTNINNFPLIGTTSVKSGTNRIGYSIQYTDSSGHARALTNCVRVVDGRVDISADVANAN